MNISPELQKFIQDIETEGYEKTVQKIKAAQQPQEPAPDLDAEEQAELAHVRHGDYGMVSRIQSKYNRLRNPVTPAQRVQDPELEAAKAGGTLQELYNQRLGKIRNGDVNSIVALKQTFWRAGMEIS